MANSRATMRIVIKERKVEPVIRHDKEPANETFVADVVDRAGHPRVRVLGNFEPRSRLIVLDTIGVVDESTGKLLPITAKRFPLGECGVMDLFRKLSDEFPEARRVVTPRGGRVGGARSGPARKEAQDATPGMDIPLTRFRR